MWKKRGIWEESHARSCWSVHFLNDEGWVVAFPYPCFLLFPASLGLWYPYIFCNIIYIYIPKNALNIYMLCTYNVIRIYQVIKKLGLFRYASVTIFHTICLLQLVPFLPFSFFFFFSFINNCFSFSFSASSSPVWPLLPTPQFPAWDISSVGGTGDL